MLLCSRQSGKSQIAAALALNTALLIPGATVLLISRALRQSAELLLKVKDLWRCLKGEKLPRPLWHPGSLQNEIADYGSALWIDHLQKLPQDSVLSMTFHNRSRIISLPGNADTVVGYSAITLLIVDEAARTPEILYRSLRPMLAVSEGRLVVLSTPFGRRGWFYDEWQRCQEIREAGQAIPWQQVRVTAEQCPRITREFLAEERLAIGDRWYRQEYECEFVEAADSVFAHGDIHGALSADIMPLDL